MEENNREEQEVLRGARAEPPVALVLLSLFALVMLGSVLGAGLAMGLIPLFGGDVSLIAGGLTADATAAERWAMRLVLGLNHLASFVAAGFLTVWLLYRQAPGAGDWRDYLGIRQLPDFRSVGMGIALIFSSIPLVLFLYSINKALPIPDYLRNMEAQATEAIKGLLIMDHPGELMANLVIIALLPAIGEEVVFRGVLQRQVQRVIFPTWLAILIAAAIFSAIHLQFEGFLSRWLLGVLLGWLYWQTGNLWVPAIAHFFNNAIQVLGQYLYKNDISTVDLEKDIDVPWYFALVSLVLVLWIIRNNASTSNNT
jgi:membrane protease YdiL (CAAX protease family)